KPDEKKTEGNEQSSKAASTETVTSQSSINQPKKPVMNVSTPPPPLLGVSQNTNLAAIAMLSAVVTSFGLPVPCLPSRSDGKNQSKQDVSVVQPSTIPPPLLGFPQALNPTNLVSSSSNLPPPNLLLNNLSTTLPPPPLATSTSLTPGTPVSNDNRKLFISQALAVLNAFASSANNNNIDFSNFNKSADSSNQLSNTTTKLVKPEPITNGTNEINSSISS
ncbi:unnamed protein product, partial [Trichobilharzia regenti]